MASIKITICCLLFGLTVRAQTFGEWFDQKNTRRKYLLQQIAAFEAYGIVLKAGYNIAHNGLGSIGSSVKTEFNLHTAYYNRLNTVSPSVKNNPQVKDIMTWQQDILTVFNGLTSDGYYQKVKAAVLKDCGDQLAELQRIVKDGAIQMNDAERLKGLNKIHTAMLGNYRFSLSFCNQAKNLELHKQQELNDAATLRSAYGNH